MTSATYSPIKTYRIHKQKPLSNNVHMVLTDEELEMETNIRELTNTPKRTDLYKKCLKSMDDLLRK